MDKWLLMVEAAGIKESMWESNKRQRLTDKICIAAFTTTPKGKICTHKLNKSGLNSDSKKWKSFLSKSIDNLNLDKEEIKAAKDDLSDYAFRQEYEAGFLTFAGRIYKDFNSEVNYKDMFYNKDSLLYMTHDFGFITPSVCSFVQTNKIDREIYFYLIDVIKEFLDDDLELYDFYITNYNYFKVNMFKNWIKAGNELDKDNETKISNITYGKRAIFHPLKTDENWEDIEYLGY